MEQFANIRFNLGLNRLLTFTKGKYSAENQIDFKIFKHLDMIYNTYLIRI